MKKLSFVLFFTIIFISNAYSQWFVQNTGATVNLNTGFFYRKGGHIMGCIDGKGNTRLLTTNGGLNWDSYQLDTGSVDLESVIFIDTSKGFILGKNFVYMTTDGGVSFTKTATLQASVRGYSLTALTSDIVGFVGFTISSQNPDSVISAQVYRINVLNGTAASIGPVLPTYESQSVSVILQARLISTAPGTIWIGLHSGLYKSTNSGNNFSLIQPLQVSCINTDSLVSQNIYLGTYTSDSAFLQISTNGGNSFQITHSHKFHGNQQNQTFYASSRLRRPYSKSNISNNRNRDSTLISTTNDGLNWEYQTLPNDSLVNSMFFIDDNTGWLMCNGGMLFHTTNGGFLTGIKPVSNEIPNNYVLSQNYPNPFNPSTIIKFNLLKDGQTSLTIYDVTGKAAAFLIDRQLRAGVYSINFNAAELSSGIYFYKLTSGEFQESKKMIILK